MDYSLLNIIEKMRKQIQQVTSVNLCINLHRFSNNIYFQNGMYKFILFFFNVIYDCTKECDPSATVLNLIYIWIFLSSFFSDPKIYTHFQDNPLKLNAPWYGTFLEFRPISDQNVKTIPTGKRYCCMVDCSVNVVLRKDCCWLQLMFRF